MIEFVRQFQYKLTYSQDTTYVCFNLQHFLSTFRNILKDFKKYPLKTVRKDRNLRSLTFAPLY